MTPLQQLMFQYLCQIYDQAIREYVPEREVIFREHSHAGTLSSERIKEYNDEVSINTILGFGVGIPLFGRILYAMPFLLGETVSSSPLVYVERASQEWRLIGNDLVTRGIPEQVFEGAIKARKVIQEFLQEQGQQLGEGYTIHLETVPPGGTSYKTAKRIDLSAMLR